MNTDCGRITYKRPQFASSPILHCVGPLRPEGQLSYVRLVKRHRQPCTCQWRRWRSERCDKSNRVQLLHTSTKLTGGRPDAYSRWRMLHGEILSKGAFRKKASRAHYYKREAGRPQLSLATIQFSLMNSSRSQQTFSHGFANN